jgi:Uma2 family endonuclease
MLEMAKTLTVEEFDQFVLRPENINRLFEYIGGEVVEVTSNLKASKLGVCVSGSLFTYLEKNDIGHLTGADGGYKVSGERYIPDVGFIRYSRVEVYEPGRPSRVFRLNDTLEGGELLAAFKLAIKDIFR